MGRNRYNPHLEHRRARVTNLSGKFCPGSENPRYDFRHVTVKKNSRFHELTQRYLAWNRAVSDIGRVGNEGSRNFLSVQSGGRGAPRHVDFEATEASAEAFSKFLSASRLFDRPVPSVGMAPDHRDHLSRGPR